MEGERHRRCTRCQLSYLFPISYYDYDDGPVWLVARSMRIASAGVRCANSLMMCTRCQLSYISPVCYPVPVYTQVYPQEYPPPAEWPCTGRGAFRAVKAPAARPPPMCVCGVVCGAGWRRWGVDGSVLPHAYPGVLPHAYPGVLPHAYPGSGLNIVAHKVLLMATLVRAEKHNQ